MVIVFSSFCEQVILGKRIHYKYETLSGHKSNIDNRIVGGEVAKEGSAPYQVSIQTIFGSHICGGVIIDQQWILTAGHCVLDYPIEVLRVHVGTNNWKQGGVVFRPELALTHCMYDIPSMYHNDIAVVRLNAPIEFNNQTQKIELASEALQPGDVLTLTGWGSPNLNQPPTEQLQKIDLTYLPHNECKNAWDGDEGVDVGHVCTYTRAGEGACNGDSGGPLVYNGKLVGLVNWGAPCAVGKPDMHASVVYYRDFIELSRTQCTKLRG